MYKNEVKLSGQVAFDNELKASKGGTYYYFGSIKLTKKEKGKTFTSYIPFVCFGDVAEEIASLGKDSDLTVKGELQMQKDKEDKYVMRLVITEVI